MGDEYVPLDEFRNGEWRIEWSRDSGLDERTTTLAAIAWYAENYDDTAEVSPVE